MKKILIAVALLSLSLSGCGSAATSPKATPSPTTTALSEWDKAQAAGQAEAASQTRFEKALESSPCSTGPSGSLANEDGFLLADQGKTLHFNVNEKSNPSDPTPPAAPGDVVCVLTELKIPVSVRVEMARTTALQGVQADTWDGIEASWTYHPDNGLDVILTDKP